MGGSPSGGGFGGATQQRPGFGSGGGGGFGAPPPGGAPMRTPRATRNGGGGGYATNLFGGTFSDEGGDWMTAAEDPVYFWGSLLSEDDISFWSRGLQTESYYGPYVGESALAQAAFYYTGVGG